MSAPQFILPDLYAVCPLKGQSSPHYEEAAAQSREWVNGYKLFKGAKLAYFLQGNNELLVSHTYPYAPFDQFRTCCDFVNLLFVVDEVSDEQDGYNARVTGEIFLNSMRYPDWDDGSALAKMTREYVPGTYLIHSVTELIFLCISPVLQSRRRPSCPLRHLLLLRARDA